MPTIIAIDGPAASGKSSVARQIAESYNMHHVDTGAMYRAITWKVLEQNIDPSDEQAIVSMLPRIEYRCQFAEGRMLQKIDGVDPSEFLKNDEVNAAVSHVARIAAVRKFLVQKQRQLGEKYDLVMDGRDIASVVFPNTPHKYYLDASEEVRAQRRNAEGSSESIAQRDHLDSTRKHSPLQVAEGAEVIDTSEMNLQEVVDRVSTSIAAKQKGKLPSTHEVGLKQHMGSRGFIYQCGVSSFLTISKAFFDYQIIGQEKLPEQGPAILASNHISFLDPPLVGMVCPGEIHYLARKTLFSNPIALWIYHQCNAIPIDQESPDIKSLRQVLKVLKEGERLLLFPEGQRSWNGELQEAASGVGMIVEKSAAPVIPIRIFGADRALGRGKILPQPAEIRVVVGDPIDFAAMTNLPEDRKERYQAISDRVMEEIAQLSI